MDSAPGAASGCRDGPQAHPPGRIIRSVLGSRTRRGRPMTFPFALAFAGSALTRSRMSSRSNWAKAASR